MPSWGTSGTIGVSWDATNSKWKAGLKHDDKWHYVGRFAEEVNAMLSARRPRRRGR